MFMDAQEPLCGCAHVIHTAAVECSCSPCMDTKVTKTKGSNWAAGIETEVTVVRTEAYLSEVRKGLQFGERPSL